MATLTNVSPTLKDFAEALDPDNRVAAVIELLNQVNEVVASMGVMEGNLLTGHRSTIRTGLPTATWRRFYQGVPPTKSSRATITDTCGMLETYNEVDKDIVELNGNTAAFRTSEARATIEGMSQQVASTLFYGTTIANPERFDGFATRYNALTGTALAENIVNGGAAGGQTDCASIWLIVWSNDTVTGIVPKGSPGGLQVTDKGIETIRDASGNMYEGYRMHFQWKLGLCVKDWRYVVRIANIDRSLLTRDAASGANLPDLMFQALELLPAIPAGARMGFYMDRTVRTYFRQQLAALTKNSTLEYTNVGGHRVGIWNDVPIFRTDALAVNETALT